MDENTTKTCANCGCTNEPLFEVNDELYCRDCLVSMGYVQCEDCGEWVRAEDALTTHDGKTICEDCYCNGYFTCDDCGDIFSEDECNTINGGTSRERHVCDRCLGNGPYYQCEDCGDFFTEHYLYSDEYIAVCQECYDNRWRTCEDCGCLVHEDDAYYIDGYAYCESCYENRREYEDDGDDCDNFHDYGFKPYPDFHCRKGENLETALTFGVEDEIDGGDGLTGVCDALADLGEPIYMKHDGSLSSVGVEVVTHPGTLNYHLYEMRWANICRTAIQHGYKSHNTTTCGLHIHVGRKQMGKTPEERDVVAARLVLLAGRLKDELTKFSRRTSTALGNWAPFPDMDIDESMPDRDLERYARGTSRVGWHGERYRAVNLTNESTVEFRIFRGTLKRDTIMASLELVSNLVKYAMTHSTHNCAFEASFADVLKVEEFKELATYAATRGLL